MQRFTYNRKFRYNRLDELEPAIGGQGKEIVREIDALGGEMALNTDFTAIQFKLLNTLKVKCSGTLHSVTKKHTNYE